MINSARTIHGQSATEFATNTARRYRQIIPALETADAPVLTAEINHDRWIVKCPFCRGAELGDPDDPRFMCLSCWNADASGRFLPVTFPPNRAGIEAELATRPRIENRNWTPGETIADLKRERK